MFSEKNLKRFVLNGLTMATRWSVLLDAELSFDSKALQAALENTVDGIDKAMSPWKKSSELNQINRAPLHQEVAVSQGMLDVIQRSIEISRLSKGAFDPAVGGLVSAWGFSAERDQPDPASIKLIQKNGINPIYLALELDASHHSISKHQPIQLDFCGIAKGYAVDKMAEVVLQHGIKHALISLDGELRACGSQGDGQPWTIAVEMPDKNQRTARGVIELEDIAIATSGDYRHWFQLGDAHVAHTMDGRHCTPVNNPITSVTVLAKNCIDADAWASALLVLGVTEGLALANQMGLEVLILWRGEKGLVELGTGRFSG